MAVPLLDIAQHNKPYFERMKAAFSEVLESGQYIGGENVVGFEKELAEFLEVKDCIATSSGTDAQLLALMVLGVGPGDEVICPSFTFFATAGVVHRLGATPVFVDIEADSFNSNANSIEKAISPITKAIMPVHLFGQMVDMEAIMKVANAHGIPVVEDAAQAIGASRNGKRAGSFGAFGSFSFYPTKNLSGFGDSGFLSTNDEELARKARILRIHGMDPVYYHSKVGGNFRFDPIQGALLRIKLPDIDAQNEKRDQNAQTYHKILLEHPEFTVDEKANPEASIVLPSTSEGNVHTWHQFTLRVIGGKEKRDAVLKWLRDHQIGCGVYYPLGLHQQRCFELVVPKEFSLPITEAASEQVISLPIFPELTGAQIEEVCAVLKSYFDQ